MAASLLRLYRLDAQSLWLDEGGTWAEVTGKGWGQLAQDMFAGTAGYPLYHLLMKAWVALAGDSEWSLRLPSALAGVAMVAALMAAARELARATGGDAPTQARSGLAAGAVAAISPYALWHAQDAKVYSLLMLTMALLLWAALRALRLRSMRAWAAVGALLLASLFVHRLALLAVAGLLLGLGWGGLAAGGSIYLPALRRRGGLWLSAALAALGLSAGAMGVWGLASAIATNGWHESGHAAAAPLESVWLNLMHFALDRGDLGGWLGVPLALWAAPALGLGAWGLALLGRAARRGAGAAAVVGAALLPLLLFALALLRSPVYEPRYAAVAFPAWALLVAWPLGQARGGGRAAALALGAALLGVNVAALAQPVHGQFSGAPVKEQWREGVAAIAAEAHPDDLLVLHPYYTEVMWRYYASRVTPDPLPAPRVFDIYGQGNCVEDNHGDAAAIRECYRRAYDDPFNQYAEGKKRALLLIAPDHAATIDPPKKVADLEADYAAGYIKQRPTTDDAYGSVGLRFAIPQRSWPCGGQTFVGVETMCQSYPEFYRSGHSSRAPQPAVALDATFAGLIGLRGYSVDMFGGAARPGGALPVTLYWQAAKPIDRPYSMFLHLCRDCTLPPLAANDGPPLHGYPDAGLTNTWEVGYPVHDERSIALPADLPPGRYTLLLGIYPADNPAEAARLPVASARGQVLGGTRLVLGQVEIGR